MNNVEFSEDNMDNPFVQEFWDGLLKMNSFSLNIFEFLLTSELLKDKSAKIIIKIVDNNSNFSINSNVITIPADINKIRNFLKHMVN